MINADIVGRLGSDPEIKTSAAGRQYCTLNVASERREKNQTGEWESITTWIRVALFSDQGLWQKMKKGARVVANGTLKVQAYIDRDNTARAGVELIAHNITLIDWPDTNSF